MNTRAKIPMTLQARALAFSVAMMVPLAGFGGEDIDETLEIAADGLVLVDNLAGSIEFVTWDRSDVQIRGEAGDDVEEVEINKTSKGVNVRVHNRTGERHVDDTELYIRIPETVSIEAEGVSSDITVSGSRGESVVLDTVSGDLEIDASVQRIELNSVSGDIEFQGTAKRSSIESVSGEITVIGTEGEIQINTVSGDVSLEAGEVTRGRFEAVSGDLTLELSLADGGRLGCDSMSGDVTLRLPASQQSRFRAQSYSGDIQTDFGQSVRVSRGPGVMLEHLVGDNGAEIRLETFSGDIAISSQ